MVSTAPLTLDQVQDSTPTYKINTDAITTLKNETLSTINIDSLGETLQKVK